MPTAREASSEEGDRSLFNFITACLGRRLLIAMPLPHAGYDLVLHHRRTQGMWRVQVKKASRNSSAWFGSTHRRRGARYPPGLIDRFVFEKPVVGGFWILEGHRFEGRTGLTLRDSDWGRWDFFDGEREGGPP